MLKLGKLSWEIKIKNKHKNETRIAMFVRVLSNYKMNSIFMEEKHTQIKKAFALAEKIRDTTRQKFGKYFGI